MKKLVKFIFEIIVREDIYYTYVKTNRAFNTVIFGYGYISCRHLKIYKFVSDYMFFVLLIYKKIEELRKTVTDQVPWFWQSSIWRLSRMHMLTYIFKGLIQGCHSPANSCDSCKNSCILLWLQESSLVFLPICMIFIY